MQQRHFNDMSIFFGIFVCPILDKDSSVYLTIINEMIHYNNRVFYITFIYGKHIISGIILILLLQHEFYSSLLQHYQYHVVYSHQVPLFVRHPFSFDLGFHACSCSNLYQQDRKIFEVLLNYFSSCFCEELLAPQSLL